MRNRHSSLRFIEVRRGLQNNRLRMLLKVYKLLIRLRNHVEVFENKIGDSGSRNFGSLF